MSKSMTKLDVSKILGKVPADKEFRFSIGVGAFTGVTANSLSDFAAKLTTIDVKSVLFHYPRGDFQRWIEGSLGDAELADRMRMMPTGLSGENLRRQMLKMIETRLGELKRLS